MSSPTVGRVTFGPEPAHGGRHHRQPPVGRQGRGRRMRWELSPMEAGDKVAILLPTPPNGSLRIRVDIDDVEGDRLAILVELLGRLNEDRGRAHDRAGASAKQCARWIRELRRELATLEQFETAEDMAPPITSESEVDP